MYAFLAEINLSITLLLLITVYNMPKKFFEKTKRGKIDLHKLFSLLFNEAHPKIESIPFPSKSCKCERY